MNYQRLSLAERYQIKALLRSKLSVRAIASNLGRHPSTISREIKRSFSSEHYSPTANHRAYLKRRQAVHPPYRIKGELSEIVLSKLNCQWSPEQISGRLKLGGTVVAHETIYQYVYRNFKQGGRIFLNLRRRRKRRRTHKAGRAYKRCGQRLSYPSIHLRPKIVEHRKRLGDYERDSVLGQFRGPALLTIVDRCSRLTKLGKIPSLCAAETHKETVRLLRKLPIHTITNDNGPEFADYNDTALKLDADVYFNDPYSSWQRGTNENTNGLIRQYFPKGTDFTLISDSYICKIEALLNNRPRKSLGYRTPNEVQNQKTRVLH